MADRDTPRGACTTGGNHVWGDGLFQTEPCIVCGASPASKGALEREVDHQATIVHDVRAILSEWSRLRSHGRGLGDPETALRCIAKRVGYYVSADAARSLIEEVEGRG